MWMSTAPLARLAAQFAVRPSANPGGSRNSTGTRTRTALACHAPLRPGFGAFSATVCGMVCGWAAAQVVPFTEEAVSRGLIYQMSPYPAPYGYVGFGCGFADLNGSGRPDAIIMGNVPRTVGIFENAAAGGGGTFIDRSEGSGIGTLPQGSAFAVGDFDGDGLLDIYFTQVTQPNRLVRNLGDFVFEDVTLAAGVADFGVSKGCAFGDYDLDGWLDLFVVNYLNGVPGAQYHRHRLYRNNADGTFTDVAPALGLDKSTYGFMVAWTDIDDDGDLDLYLVNDRGHLPPYFQGNILWRNDGDGTFTDISAGSGADVQLFGMGLAVGDFDGSGWSDFYVTNIAVNQPPIFGINPLLLNQGDNTFVEAAEAWGVHSYITSWASIFFDFTNNGWLDLYVNNMFVGNRLYKNTGVPPLADVALQAGVRATAGSGIASFASAVADVDGDGTLDLLVNNLGGNVELFMNNEGKLRNWLKLRLVGEHPNAHAIGANARILADGRWQTREVFSGTNGYLTQNDLTLHWGLGNESSVTDAIVHWPGRVSTRTFTNIPGNAEWTIYPPSRLGDANGDGSVGFTDFWVFVGCFDKAVKPGLEMMDFTGDFEVGLADAEAFLAKFAQFNGPLPDCNDNGIPDLLEIILDPSLDLDQNGVLDECEAGQLLGDLNGDGIVGSTDLGILLSAWGKSGPADLNGDGTVDGADLGILLSNWTQN